MLASLTQCLQLNRVPAQCHSVSTVDATATVGAAVRPTQWLAHPPLSDLCTDLIASETFLTSFSLVCKTLDLAQCKTFDLAHWAAAVVHDQLALGPAFEVDDWYQPASTGTACKGWPQGHRTLMWVGVLLSVLLRVHHLAGVRNTSSRQMQQALMR